MIFGPYLNMGSMFTFVIIILSYFPFKKKITVYCAHEYTQSNAKFAMSVEPGNSKLVSRVAGVTSKRQSGEPTVPSLLGVEKETNPFLRVDVSDEIQKNVGALSSDSYDVIFGKVRKAKDNFRG